MHICAYSCYVIVFSINMTKIVYKNGIEPSPASSRSCGPKTVAFFIYVSFPFSLAVWLSLCLLIKTKLIFIFVAAGLKKRSSQSEAHGAFTEKFRVTSREVCQDTYTCT